MTDNDIIVCPACGVRYTRIIERSATLDFTAYTPVQEQKDKIKTALQAQGITEQDVRVNQAIDGKITVRTVHKLEPTAWRLVSDTLKRFGFAWVSDRERSHWGV